MAHAAWTHHSLNLSSWSCMGPRRRSMSPHSNCKDSPDSPASANAESSDPLLSSPKKRMTTAAVQNMDLPVSSSIAEWSSEIECSCAGEMNEDGDVGLSDSQDMMDHYRHEHHISEAELWQQLEHELYDKSEGVEADVVKEIREEAATIAEVTDEQIQSSAPEMKEIHRFFPPGKIMHIVTLHSEVAENENDGSPASTSSDNSQPDETKIGIFLTSRSLYSKLRLSQTMISDHFMPVYRRQIERIIKELEEEESAQDHRVPEVVL